MRVFNIIKVIGLLLQNAMTQRSKFDLSFYHEDDGIWYVGNLFYETDYDATVFRSFQRSVWLCPVTLFVPGRYTKYIYIKQICNCLF